MATTFFFSHHLHAPISTLHRACESRGGIVFKSSWFQNFQKVTYSNIAKRGQNLNTITVDCNRMCSQKKLYNQIKTGKINKVQQWCSIFGLECVLKVRCIKTFKTFFVPYKCRMVRRCEVRVSCRLAGIKHIFFYFVFCNTVKIDCTAKKHPLECFKISSRCS